MTQNLGRVERPFAEQYRGKRKLLLAPLLFAPQVEGEDGAAIVARYWEQVTGPDRGDGGQPGAGVGGSTAKAWWTAAMKVSNTWNRPMAHSAGLVRDKCGNGAVLEPTEDGEVLFEIVDLQRILMIPDDQPAGCGTDSGMVRRRQPQPLRGHCPAH